jgi:hypothetical protein
MWNVSIEKPRKDRHGKTWNFSYWYSVALAAADLQFQRLFFWDDDHKECGVIVFARDKTVPYTRNQKLDLRIGGQVSRKAEVPKGSGISA